MINFDDVRKEETEEHYPDHPYRILIIGGPGSGKANSLFNLINQQPDNDKIYLYAKDIIEAKYEFLIKKREDVATKHFNDSKTFIEYSNNIDGIYKNIEVQLYKNRKILIAFDDMISDILNDKIHNSIVTELFIRGKNLKTSLVFITRSYFPVSKDIRLTFTHRFIMKIPNKQELQEMAFTNSSHIIDFKDFLIIYKNILQNRILF